jgi:hypothetical protein
VWKEQGKQKTTMKTAPRTIVRLNPQVTPINKVMGYRNEAVTQRIAKDLGLDAKSSEVLFKDMLRFLYISQATNIRPISPPKMIDEAWHTFIIYTKDYAEFCEHYFGRFIHHRPYRPGEKPETGSGNNCLMLAKLFFGKALSANWGIAQNSSCDECKECSTKSCSTKSCEGGCREECCI